MSKDAEKKLAAQMGKLSADGKLIVSILTEEINKLRSEFSTSLAERDAIIEGLRSDVTQLREKVDKLEHLVDDADAYERRDTVILSGPAIPPVGPGEQTAVVVKDLVKDKLNLEIGLNDISVAHRLGKKPINQIPDRRSIVVKLCRRDLKRTLISGSFNQRNPSIYVNESLTAPRRTIMFTLRQIRKAHPNLLAGCSSYEGRVFAKTKDPNASNRKLLRHPVNTHDQLKNFCREHIKQPLERFLQEWTH